MKNGNTGFATLSREDVRTFLNDRQIKYVSISHSAAYSDREVAEKGWIPRRQLVRTIPLQADGARVMVVLPTTHKLDVQRLKEAWQVAHLEMLNQAELQTLFPGCSPHAVPPLGHLLGMPVIMDATLHRPDGLLAFTMGSDYEMVSLTYHDFEALVTPTIMPLPILNRYTTVVDFVAPETAALEAQDRCFLGISLGNANSVGARLEASLDWIQAHFKHCAVFIADGIHRLTVQLGQPALSEAEATDKALRLGRTFIEEERRTFERFQSACKFEFVFCSDIQQQGKYSEYHQQIQRLFTTNQAFRTSVQRFTAPFAQRSRAANRQALGDAYLLEELAAFACMAEAGWPVMIYPGAIGPLAEIAQGAHPQVPQALAALVNVSLRHKKRRRG